MNDPNMYNNHQLAQHYLQEIQAENESPIFTEQRQSVNQIYRIIQIRHRSLLAILERYNVPPIIIETTTKSIIRFTLNNANSVPGNINQKVNVLFRNFVRRETRTILILTAAGVPRSSINRFIRGVIRATLQIIGDSGGGVGNIRREVNRILRLFERRFPTFLGLTTTYRIPRATARRITRDIIAFTLRNLNRISRFGSIQQRANQMLRLLDTQRPDLIRAMIVRGVPAGRAEEIARRIIVFTLRNENIS